MNQIQFNSRHRVVWLFVAIAIIKNPTAIASIWLWYYLNTRWAQSSACTKVRHWMRTVYEGYCETLLVTRTRVPESNEVKLPINW